VRSVQAFPFVTEELSVAVSNTLPQLFLDDERYRPLGSLIDRVTFIATHELLRSPGDISLKEKMKHLDLNPQLSRAIVGVILERQLDALGRNIWKDGARLLAKHLLDELSSLYEDVWPVRKMRILVRRLEFSYFSAVADAGWDITVTLAEMDKLSKSKVLPHFFHS
jgi:separase